MKMRENAIRVVRLYVFNDRVYYLSVEGDDLAADNKTVERFFGSFLIKN